MLKTKDKINTNVVNMATGVLDLFININNSSYNIATGVRILTAGVIYPSFLKGFGFIIIDIVTAGNRHYLGIMERGW